MPSLCCCCFEVCFQVLIIALQILLFICFSDCYYSYQSAVPCLLVMTYSLRLRI
jgi:hypothetical protein